MTNIRVVNMKSKSSRPSSKPNKPVKPSQCQTRQIKEEGEAKKPEWVIDIQAKVDQAQQDEEAGAWDKHCIYRIPQFLQENEKKAYIPQTVSLGPYHHGKEGLGNMDPHKWRALHHVLKRRPDLRIEDYYGAVKGLEADARACYEGPIDLSSGDFMLMMVLDACFVLEIFRGHDTGFTTDYSQNDPIFADSGAIHSIQRDMLMLENQIPLFILEKLFGLQSDKKGEVERLAQSFFHQLIPTYPLPEKSSDGYQGTALHCLDVFRRSLLHGKKAQGSFGKKEGGSQLDEGTKVEGSLSDDGKRAESSQLDNRKKAQDGSRLDEGIKAEGKRSQQKPIHCVTQLKDAGVKFKIKESQKFWPDITFSRGILEIPRLLIDDGTKSLLLNLIAYEQRHVGCSNEITSYVIFMDNLIDSPNDVSYLHRHGIIENWLGSDAETADLFNRLCKDVVFDINDSSLSEVNKQVNAYYEKRRHAWKASFKRTYFKNPWSVISLIAASVLLFLTFVQTFYTAYAYHRPPP